MTSLWPPLILRITKPLTDEQMERIREEIRTADIPGKVLVLDNNIEVIPWHGLPLLPQLTWPG